MPSFPYSRLALAAAVAGSLVGCSSTPPTDDTPHTVLISGSLEIPATYDVDLDAGVVPTSETFSDGDIWNESVSGSVDLLSVVTTTTFAVIGTTSPGYAGCVAASYGTTSYALIGATVGTYFCVKTNQNHYAQVKLTKTATEADHNINIDFITWN